MDDQLKMKNFLKFIRSQKEPGLLIVEDSSKIDEITGLLDRQEFKKVSDWKEALESLGKEGRIYVVLDKKLPKELYDLVAQFSTGGVEIFDTETLQSNVVQFNPNEIEFIIVSTQDNLDSVEKDFSLKDKVGLIEIIL
jgi:hypothetical protein